MSFALLFLRHGHSLMHCHVSQAAFLLRRPTQMVQITRYVQVMCKLQLMQRHIENLQLPEPLPAQAGADSPYPIEGPFPSSSNGEPDPEVRASNCAARLRAPTLPSGPALT